MPLSMIESMRWYGPGDQVPLQHIRQAGASAVYTSLHDIPYGEVWPREAIRGRKALVERHGLDWIAVESLPVHEDIKTRSGDFRRHIDNYKQSLRNLGVEGIGLVIYNFMPVLDWVRTDLAHVLPDGSQCLSYDPVRFAAFDVHLLGRKGAEKDWTEAQLRAAEAFVHSLDAAGRAAFERSIIDVFPGCRMGLTLDDVRAMLATYDHIDAARLKEHYYRFLAEVAPVAEAAGVRLAVHPDDPPLPHPGAAAHRVHPGRRAGAVRGRGQPGQRPVLLRRVLQPPGRQRPPGHGPPPGAAHPLRPPAQHPAQPRRQLP